MKYVLKQRHTFDAALEKLSVFRSTMSYNDNPEVVALQAEFDKGFKELRDKFQPKLDKAALTYHEKGGRV